MFAPEINTPADFAVALLIHYSFDLGGYTASELINRWLKDYPDTWVRMSVIEALYQGRYKAISVEQILSFWQRRGQAVHHFNHEFERLICGNFPQTLIGQLNQINTSSVVPVRIAAQGAVENTPVQLVDTTTNFLSSNSSGGEKSNNENDESDRGDENDNSRAIEQFTPTADGSDFYSKLKAISQHNGSKDK